ncbi:MAG TPA: NAD-dependent epimerase/dehydratase family protein [Thermoanaerobaculia bacterium]|nr:NAD-dependent epimerase/dehydratase family protein [Thermoanaerobaculia bacterium]
MRFFVTGGAGFIGSHVTDRLLALGHEVVVYDNFSTGREEFLEDARRSSRATLVRGDTLDLDGLRNAMAGCEFVIHLAANADVRFGSLNPRRDFEQNTLATFHVLDAMRLGGIQQIAFASTGSVYGEASVFPTPEDAPFPIQTSFYAASKLACEGLVEAYSEAYGFRSFIFRFVSILGERYTHGHVYDFVKSLRADPAALRVLGNGRQRKSYLYVHDCISAMLTAFEQAPSRLNILNLGTDEYCEVNDSIRWITERIGVTPQLEYTGGERGWVGDSPFIFLDCARVRALGWRPELSIREGVVRTVEYLQSHPWMLESRIPGSES